MSWLNKPYSMLALTTIMIGLPVMFIAAIPWLKQQPESVVYLCAGIAATGTVVASFVLAIQKHQKFDEWHRSAARFSSQWGWLAGAGTIAILLSFPALQNAIVAVSGSLGDVAAPDRKLVLMAFTGGFMSVVLAQMVCTVGANQSSQRGLACLAIRSYRSRTVVLILLCRSPSSWPLPSK